MFFFSKLIAMTNSLKVLRKFTIMSSTNREMCKQDFRLNLAVIIRLWNTFNHTFWVFNVTKLLDWCKQAYLIQTNSALSLCECVRLLYTKPDYVYYYPDKPFNLRHSPIFCLSNQEVGGYIYNVHTEERTLIKVISMFHQHHFFPGLFFYVYIESLNPKKAPHHRPQTPSTENPNP